MKELRGEADDIVCLEDYVEFGAIGLFYSDFRQVSDTEVIAMLAKPSCQIAGRCRLTGGVAHNLSEINADRAFLRLSFYSCSSVGGTYAKTQFRRDRTCDT